MDVEEPGQGLVASLCLSLSFGVPSSSGDAPASVFGHEDFVAEQPECLEVFAGKQVCLVKLSPRRDSLTYAERGTMPWCAATGLCAPCRGGLRGTAAKYVPGMATVFRGMPGECRVACSVRA